MKIVIHRSLKHPHVVALLDVLEDDQSVYIVMEYASGGELFDKIGLHFPLLRIIVLIVLSSS